MVCRFHRPSYSTPNFLKVPTLQDPRPGRFIRHIDFSHFRTIGMRRSVEESVTSRFVTGDRVETILKVSPYPSTRLPHRLIPSRKCQTS